MEHLTSGGGEAEKGVGAGLEEVGFALGVYDRQALEGRQQLQILGRRAQKGANRSPVTPVE